MCKTRGRNHQERKVLTLEYRIEVDIKKLTTILNHEPPDQKQAVETREDGEVFHDMDAIETDLALTNRSNERSNSDDEITRRNINSEYQGPGNIEITSVRQNIILYNNLSPRNNQNPGRSVALDYNMTEESKDGQEDSASKYFQ
ncbi:hypothetical protein K7X08_006545 [Anisodus acutangulus]|uniref:Uncharacterized protein n=1 Tax=Anisodus acutangulus TaxID=402998 RepID=A0A9Q1RS31_9SOLA|nr:hypothetical protein K7X08_006545 [Anisodus acutangulus]